MRIAPSSRGLQGLSATGASTFSGPCRRAALETSAGTVGLAVPGRVELFGADGTPVTIAVDATTHASRFLPVRGTSGELWFLAEMPSGWSVFGVGPDGAVTGTDL